MFNLAFVSHEFDQRTRVCHADAPAPLGSRERASRGCPHRGAAVCRPTFVTAMASDTPYAQPGLCASRVPPSRPRRRSACACAPGHAPTDLPALPDSPPAPRSEPHCNILPPYCSAAGPGSETRQPEPLASHALLHGVRSCTSSPELPPVAYEIDAVAPTLFGCCQRRWSVGSGGAENTNWRTQVFRAILERQCVLESERGSACLTRETRKQRGVVGVRLGPLS